MSAICEQVDAALAGSRPALARLLSIAERSGPELLEIEDRISARVGNALVVGVTGPPGAGKSTLINALLPHALKDFDGVGVLAVDPSSPFSDGAILGDRVRMQGGEYGSSVFIRSMASRGELGGLARAASTAMRLMDACGWSLIIIETLGIGQVELDVMNLADTTLVVLNPGWGDTIQANKAGLTEAGDVFVINKADKPGADVTRTDLLESLSLLNREPPPPVCQSTASTGDGVAELWTALRDHQDYLKQSGQLDSARAHKQQLLVRRTITHQLTHEVERLMDSDLATSMLDQSTLGQLDLRQTVDRLLRELARPRG